MTEAEWLACDDPQRMLAFLGRTRRRSAASDRKLRLFAAACVRHGGGCIGEAVLPGGEAWWEAT
jgi:hypothetical protein